MRVVDNSCVKSPRSGRELPTFGSDLAGHKQRAGSGSARWSRTSLRWAVLGGVASTLFAQVAVAQDDVDAELDALEQQATAEPEQAPAPQEAAVEQAVEVAQPESAQAADDGTRPDDEVIVVLGRKKSLQDYSGTAMAFSEKKLQTVGVTKVHDLAQMVPGLQIGVQEGAVEVYIRGVGNDNNSEHGDMGVAIHLDGVYLPRPRGVGAMFFDVQQVEVNSGPQGTLKGRNAQGGSINIVSNKPVLGEFGANAEATFGTFAERRYQGMVNIPIGDSLAIRWAGFSSAHDPHWQNGGPRQDIRAPQDEDAYAWRVQAKWEPSAKLSVIAAYDYTAERGTGYVGANFDRPLNWTNELGEPTPVAPAEVDNPRRIYQLGHQSYMNLVHQGYRLEGRYDAGPVIIEALGSYRDLKYDQRTGGSAGVIFPGFDWDQDEPIYYGGSYGDFPSQSIVAELRAFAPDTDRFRWTVGAFFLSEEQEAYLGQTSDPANFYGGAEFNMPNVHGDSIAGYADATFDVTDNFRVFAGARFTSENKTRTDGIAMQLGGFPANAGRYGTQGFEYAFRDRELGPLTAAELNPEGDPVQGVINRVNFFLDGVRSFGAQDTLPAAICNDPVGDTDRLALNENGKLRCAFGVSQDLIDSNGFNIGVVNQTAEAGAKFLDYRVGAEYDFSKDSLAYASLSTAHKAPGYNDTIYRPDGVQVFSSLYGPETVTALELGTKNDLFDRKLRLNASAFMYIYEDQVFQQIVQIAEATDTTTQAPSTSARQNAASSNILGLDMDIIYRLPFGLEAELHALFMDARYGKETLVNDGRIDFSVAEYQVDIDGNWLPRASPYTLNYSLSQELATDTGMFDWVVQAQTRGKHFLTVFNGEGNLLPEANGEQPEPGQSPAYDLLSNVSAARLTDVVPTYTRFDLGGGWRHPDGRISIRGYVNNVFNINYATTIISTPNLNLRFFNPPRTAGVRVRVAW